MDNSGYYSTSSVNFGKQTDKMWNVITLFYLNYVILFPVVYFSLIRKKQAYDIVISVCIGSEW
jgi:hypothetical protein